MTPPRCCCDDPRNPAREPRGTGHGPRRISWSRRFLAAANWLGPGALLALMPKCPVCFAAYIALFTGIGLSAPAAARFRSGLILLCIASLSFLAARTLYRLSVARRLAPS